MSTATLPRILFALLLLTTFTASAQGNRWEVFTYYQGTALERRGGGVMETNPADEEPRIAFVNAEKRRPDVLLLGVSRQYPQGLLCSVSGRVVVDDMIFDDLTLGPSDDEDAGATFIYAGDNHERMIEAIVTGSWMIIEIESRRCDRNGAERMQFSLAGSASAIEHARSLKRGAE